MAANTKSEKDIGIKDRIIDSALKLAAAHGWSDVTLREIAADAELSISELYAQIDDKDDILILLGKRIDREVLDNIGDADDTESVRDRLFDIMMERYDVLNDYRDGILALIEDFKCDPKQIVIGMPYLCRSMSWMLEACGIETSGVKGALKVAGLSGVYIKVLKTWAEDESDDLSQTMSALDKALEKAESAADMLGL